MPENTNPDAILDQLPLTEATFFILLSLASGRKHGYAIMKDVAALSDERIKLGTGTLYGALGRMLDQGWIERIDEADEEGGRPRKVYGLTDFGQRILHAESQRLHALLGAVRARLAGGRA